MRSSAVVSPITNQHVASTPRQDYVSWGRYPRVGHRTVYQVYWTDQIPQMLETAAPESLLPYGLGRSYGDSCLNEGRSLMDCRRLDRILGLDFDEGWIRCECGVSLADILELCVPHGWFLPVTPGTKFVTVGGAIANDVHGKNHHRAGSFGCHVRRLALYRSDCGLRVCGPEENRELFQATIGGLGLTGVIAWAEIQLKRIQSANIDVEARPFRSLTEFLEISTASDANFEHTVAWIDCFSGEKVRGIFFRGNHSAQGGAKAPERIGPKLPFGFPEWVLNRYTVAAFNALYFARNAGRRGRSVEPYGSFFYPLDSVREWNLIYGRRGFLQYQCVIPEVSLLALQHVLRLISESGMGSFLGVLKRFGVKPSPGMMSFPRPGLTLALDFAMRGESTLRLMRALDEIVLESGGALYPAKDARMSREMFTASFPNWRDFQRCLDPKLSSSFWRRVAGG